MNAQDRLHFGLIGEPFLFASLRIDSFGSFTVAALFVATTCFSERMLTLAISRRWNPLPILRRTRLRVSIWRAALYWVVTLQRMLYMLAAMSLNLWILTVIVTSLAVGQFAIELAENPRPGVDPESGYHLPRQLQDARGVKEPLLAPSTEDYELRSPSPYQQEHQRRSQQTHIRFPTSPANPHPHSVSPFQMSPSFQYTPPMVSEQAGSPATRPRSKSKPDEIFIHPTNSNIARAEVIATRMGFGAENNEYVDTSSYTYPRSPSINDDTSAPINHRRWGAGNGRDVARGLLGGSSSNPNAGL